MVEAYLHFLGEKTCAKAEIIGNSSAVHHGVVNGYGDLKIETDNEEAREILLKAKDKVNSGKFKGTGTESSRLTCEQLLDLE